MQPPRRPGYAHGEKPFCPLAERRQDLFQTKLGRRVKLCAGAPQRAATSSNSASGKSLDRAVDGSQYDHEPYCVDGHTEVIVRGGTPYGSRSVSSCSASLHTRYEATAPYSTAQYCTCLRSGQCGHSGQGTWQAGTEAGTRRPRKSLATRIPGATAEANLIQYRPAVPHLPADAVANAIRGSSKMSGHAGGPHSTSYSPSSYPPPCLFLTAPW